MRYLLYILQIVFLAFLIIGFFAVSEVNKEINSKISKINQEKIEFEEVKEKLLSLEKQVQKLKIKPVNKQEALNLIINKANFFLKTQNAKVVEDIKDQNQTLSITMMINIPINSKKQVEKLLKNLNNSKYPIIEIENFEIKSGETKTFLKIIFKLIQIYKV